MYQVGEWQDITQDMMCWYKMDGTLSLVSLSDKVCQVSGASCGGPVAAVRPVSLWPPIPEPELAASFECAPVSGYHLSQLSTLTSCDMEILIYIAAAAVVVTVMGDDNHITCQDDNDCIVTQEDMCCFDLSDLSQSSKSNKQEWSKKCCNEQNGFPVIWPANKHNLSESEIKQVQ